MVEGMAISEVTAGVIRPLLSLKAAYVVGGQLLCRTAKRSSLAITASYRWREDPARTYEASSGAGPSASPSTPALRSASAKALTANQFLFPGNSWWRQ